MCGVAAIFAYRSGAPAVDEAELRRINDAMARRGPDGEGLWRHEDGRVALAHKRLAIIDPGPSGAQPMTLKGAKGPLVISYNGEIYNFRALRKELEDEGVRFAANSDTEVILHLYEMAGPAMVERLRGMFALAIWDEGRRRLFLARDPFGIKPLYYADDGRTLRVASQVKALRAGGRIDTTPDPAAQVGFLLLGSVPEPHTVFKGVKLLRAGHWLMAGEDGITTERHFDPRPHFMEGRHEADAVPEILRQAIGDSVRHHMVSDVPVGVFLSSGMDSATVTAHAAAVHGASLDTVTLGFREYAGSPYDEVPLAEQVAAQYATRQHTTTVAAAEFGDAFGDVMAAMDQPSIDGVNTYFVAKAAAETGLKVALSGVGGDELFGGYYTFSQIPTLVRGLGWVPGLRPLGAGFRALAAPLVKHMASPKWASLFEYGGDYPGAYLLRRGLYLPWELPDVMDADAAREGIESLDPLHRLADTVAGVNGAGARVSALEISWYLGNQLLRDADWAGMAHSLEIRTPLVDAVLFAAVAGIGATKRQMASTPEPPLPPAVLEKPKTGFLVPVREWMAGGGTGGEDGRFAGERGFRGWARLVYDRALAA